MSPVSHCDCFSSSSASHAVGTTVRVQDFLSRIPVRKQTALKSSNRTTTTIRKLLQAYAFARSEMRFSLKVLKAKNEKANWAFAPSTSTDSLTEVASKIVGREVADQCEQQVVASETAVGSESGWEIQAVVISSTSGKLTVCTR